MQIYLIFAKDLIWDLEERKAVVFQEKEDFVCAIKKSNLLDGWFLFLCSKVANWMI